MQVTLCSSYYLAGLRTSCATPMSIVRMDSKCFKCHGTVHLNMICVSPTACSRWVRRRSDWRPWVRPRVSQKHALRQVELQPTSLHACRLEDPVAFARRIHRMIALGLALDEPEATEDAKEQGQDLPPPEEQDEGSRMEEVRRARRRWTFGFRFVLRLREQDQGSRMEEVHPRPQEVVQGLG